MNISMIVFLGLFFGFVLSGFIYEGLKTVFRFFKIVYDKTKIIRSHALRGNEIELGKA